MKRIEEKVYYDYQEFEKFECEIINGDYDKEKIKEFLNTEELDEFLVVFNEDQTVSYNEIHYYTKVADKYFICKTIIPLNGDGMAYGFDWDYPVVYKINQITDEDAKTVREFVSSKNKYNNLLKEVF